MNKDDLLDDVVAQLADGDHAVLNAAFLTTASRCGKWDKSVQYAARDAMTIFVPQSFDGAAFEGDDGPIHFEEFWNRHVVPGMVSVGSNGVQQVTCLANLVYALYPCPEDGRAATTHRIGGVDVVEAWNIRCNGCMFHVIAAASLPAITPTPGWRLRTTYVAGEVVEVAFADHGAGALGDTCMVASITKTDRTLLAPHRKVALGAPGGAVCDVVVPDVPCQTTANLWFALYDNVVRHQLVTWKCWWDIVIHPNPSGHPNLRIDDINPKSDAPNRELWIHGSGFQKTDVRVTFDDQSAHVIDCVDNLIRCYIPPGSGTKTIWVANGCVYARLQNAFVYRAP